MAKRFTDTEKWRDPWFCSLTSDERTFWFFLLDNCNLAGIWQVNWPLVKFYIPTFEFNEKVFCDRIQVLTPEKWFIPKFIKFQYGELQPNNRLHQRIIFELQKVGVSRGLKYPFQGVKDKDKDKDMDKDKEKDKEGNGDFDVFWKTYPRKIGKGAAEKSWNRLSPNSVVVVKIMAALAAQRGCEQWQRDGGQFIPYPATWLNQKRWEDEIAIAAVKKEIVT